MPAALVLAPLVVGALLLISAASKVREAESTRSAMMLLRLPSGLTTPLAARLVPALDAAAAAALILTPAGVPAVAGAVLGLILMLTYWGLVARALTFDPRPSCGCFGRLGNHQIEPLTLVRNSLLVLAALAWLVATFEGASVVGLLRDGGPDVGWWLLGVALTVALTWLVIRPDAPSPASSLRPVEIDDLPEAGEPDDYKRRAIPAATLVMPDQSPVSLWQLAAERPQLLVFVNCHCGSTHETATLLPTWREQIPAVDVRLVSTLGAAATEAAVPPLAGEVITDHAAVAYTQLGLTSSPCAVLLGADGLLAGGPVWGVGEVSAMVDEIAEILAEAEPSVSSS